MVCYGRDELSVWGAYIAAMWCCAAGLFLGFLGPYFSLRLRVNDTGIDIRYMLSMGRNIFIPWQHITDVEVVVKIKDDVGHDQDHDVYLRTRYGRTVKFSECCIGGAGGKAFVSLVRERLSKRRVPGT